MAPRAHALAPSLAPATVAALTGLITLRFLVPLAALARRGEALPGLPLYEHDPTPGDADAYYYAAREVLYTAAHLGTVEAALALAAAVLAAAAWALLRRAGQPAFGLLLGVGLIAAAVTVVVANMRPTGSPTVGWPLVWALGTAPVRAAGGLDEDGAFAVGLVLSLAANAVTVLALFVIALRVSRSQPAALAAAALFALWPVLTGLVAGPSSWSNGTWHVDAGLHMYSEPLSTALVTAAMALLVVRLRAETAIAGGTLLGFAAAVRSSNAVLVALVVAVVLVTAGRALAAWLAGGAAAAGLVAAAYWSKGYGDLLDDPVLFPEPPFSLDYVVRNWTDSALVTPRFALLLMPLALLGAVRLRRSSALPLLLTWVATNPIVYSFYFFTWETPRFLFASLPAFLLLVALGLEPTWTRPSISAGRHVQPGRASCRSRACADLRASRHSREHTSAPAFRVAGISPPHWTHRRPSGNGCSCRYCSRRSRAIRSRFRFRHSADAARAHSRHHDDTPMWRPRAFTNSSSGSTLEQLLHILSRSSPLVTRCSAFSAPLRRV